MTDSHERSLKALERRGRLRHLSPRAGLDFSSNDYLGLANSPELKQAVADALARGVAVGAGGSRLLRGNDPEHEALEAEAARFFGSETALYFGGGFQANLALLATLPDRDDLVLFDALVHASVRDGIKAGKAHAQAVPHNDVQAFADAMRSWRESGGKGRIWVAVESLYSMDGDRAPLDELAALAERHGATLLVDEAHATGVLGPDGRGLAAHLEGRPDILTLHTCGKALGASGALVLAPRVLRDFLVNRSRPFIYATAPSPLMAAAVRAALRLVAEQPRRSSMLAERVALVGRQLPPRTGVAASGSHIVPVVVGSDSRATALAGALQRRGFDVRAVRPPTVPEGTARLRISLTLNTDDSNVLHLIDVLAEELSAIP